ncbi:DNA helicase [Lentibacillus sp. JNUCC-1]|uniref:RecQ family ATP-dependent DNA helicase n=1 Tax=Lentibacillus sp. JNUCC-1 TaxID=2654513 RepID=UPI0012E7E079|nr:ATP-dependent DNA helicase RecQ [Lentibacillus sp. JNUCC-1]MUV39751.1 DNA helicase [Lentibacillus sp. JNUCC-1]
MPSRELEKELKHHLNYDAFRTGQKAIIEDVMGGHDVMGVLPTGSGKSLCYQLPAQLLKGLTIVVSPLISLMTDQVKQLRAQHYKGSIALNSFMSPKERQEVLRSLGAYKLIYISPELLQNPVIMTAFKRQEVSLFVIDEAHCISQWGHEFRPDYMRLSETIAHLGNPPVMALSATATPQVQEDIIRVLNLPNIKRHIHPMDRQNIMFAVEQVFDHKDKMSRLKDLLEMYQAPTLIYFSSRQLTEEVALNLQAAFKDRRIAYYHGGMEQSDRLLIQQQFMNDQTDVICCTSAFGMGIDKSDIHLIVHYHFPTQLESYIQEVGRAGRDGKDSMAVLLYDSKDVHLSKRLLANELPDEQQLGNIISIIRNLSTTSRKLPFDEEMILMTGLNEIQWRFLKHQLMKRDIITEDGRFIQSADDWVKTIDTILSHIQQRMGVKEHKLKQMVDWMETTNCLRYELYRHFQDGYTKRTVNCCSNCGLQWDKRIISERKRESNGENWHMKLRKRLLQQ